MVLAHARAHGWQWGRDIVYTGGPWSLIYTLAYHPDLVVLLLVTWGALALLWTAAWAALLADVPIPAGSAAFLAATWFVAGTRDAFFIGLTAVLASVALTRRGTVGLILATILAAACGVLALAKTTTLLAAAIVCVALDVRTVVSRRPPLLTLAMAAGFLVGYVGSGQRLADLGTFFALMGSVAAGYGDAMHVTDPADAAERLRVDVHELASLRALVSGAPAASAAAAAAVRAQGAAARARPSHVAGRSDARSPARSAVARSPCHSRVSARPSPREDGGRPRCQPRPPSRRDGGRPVARRRHPSDDAWRAVARESPGRQRATR